MRYFGLLQHSLIHTPQFFNLAVITRPILSIPIHSDPFHWAADIPTLIMPRLRPTLPWSNRCFPRCGVKSTSVDQGMNQSVLQSILQSINESIGQSIYQSINQTINQSINQSASQSVSQSVSQSINQNSTTSCCIF